MALIKQLTVSGYRSIRDLTLKLDRVNVIVGPNGCGKSNLYRALYLVAAAANGTLARALAGEGGLPSVFWAGKRHKLEKRRIAISVVLDDLTYDLEFGRIPISDRPKHLGLEPFINDPDIKEERIVFQNDAGKDIVLLQRDRSRMMARNMDGRPTESALSVMESESVLSGLREPHKFPELSLLRQRFLSWRFYHKFRTDLHSPLRQPQIGILTPVLAHDGVDLAAAIATIKAIGDGDYFDEAIDKAFPGSAVSICSSSGEFQIEMSAPKFKRDLDCKELSDGTLQYLCLLAALLSPRPAPFLAINEPETSIHPDLFQPLAELIVHASESTQIWLTTHSRDLANYIVKLKSQAKVTELEKVEGATRIVGLPVSQIEKEEEEGFWDDTEQHESGHVIDRLSR